VLHQSLTEHRGALLESGEATREVVEIGQFIAEVRVAAAFEAERKSCALAVLLLEPGMRVLADRHILASAVTNLLQNAFKFTRPGSYVQLKAYGSGERVLIDVEDECGGPPDGAAKEIFMPLRQQMEAQGGTLYVRNVPGKGCVSTIDLPRAAEPAPAGQRLTRRQ
jgi:signal transduction histidine kinase